MNLSEMRQLLTARGIQLTKSLGQNFLHDGNQLRRIADVAGLVATDRVVEVGPGLGPLTELLLARAGRVLAIEKDARLVAVLRERLGGAGNLCLVQGDALDWVRPGAMEHGQDPGAVAFREYLLSEGGDWKLVSNLPYSVASPLMVDLAWSRYRPERMVVTLQLEVGRRLAARPGTTDYGALTLLMQLDYAVASWFKVPAGCFFPSPEVDSACVSLSRRPEALVESGSRETYRRLVKTGFSQRRKMMLKLLKQHWPAAMLERAFAACGLSAAVRAEALGLEQFVRLTEELGPWRPAGEPGAADGEDSGVEPVGIEQPND